MNSPEEKAKQLYSQFEKIIIDANADAWSQQAKQCSLICVDEIIATLDKFADYWDLKRGEWYKDELVKIEKVKEEIQKL